MTSANAESSPLDTTVCVFAWNEAATVEQVVRAVAAELARNGRPHEVLVVDDGSTDGTEAVVDRLSRELDTVRVVHHPANRGLGGVYRTGFDHAKGGFLTFVPADGQFEAHLVSELRRVAEDHDLVLGYLPARRDLVGKTLSGIERALYRALLGPMPRFQGLFMVRTDVLRRVPLLSSGRGWAIVMEMILRIHRAGYRVTSIPTTIKPRLVGQSKVNNLRNIKANVVQLVALRELLKSG